MHLVVILFLPDERDQMCLSHLAVLFAPTLPIQETEQGKGKGKDPRVSVQEDFRLTQLPLAARWLPILFKQITPSKRRLLMLENGPQAGMALIYLLLEDGSQSLPVAIMNLVLPLAQIFLGRIAFYPTLMSRIVIEHVAQRLARAIEDQNWPSAKHIARDCLLWTDLHVLRRVLRSCTPWQQLLLEDAVERSKEEDRAMLEAAQTWMKRLLCGIKGELLFSECCLRDIHGRILGILLREGRVEHRLTYSYPDLRLRDNSFGPDGIRAIVDGLKESQTGMDVLDLSHCTDCDGIKQGLCDSEGMLPVRCLVLNDNKMGDLGAREIAIPSFLVGDRLRELYLRGNGIGDAGAEAIALALQECNLELLDLQSNNIGDPGALALARNLVRPRELKHLYLQNNSIGEDGIEHLLQAREKLEHCEGNYKLITKLELGLDPQKRLQ